MPSFAAGHSPALFNALASPQINQQIPPVPSPRRRKSTPPLSPMARSSRSSRPRNPRQPPCRRQIPIDRTGPTTEPDPTAVSSPEACPTPADRARRSRTDTAGVRQPLTIADIDLIPQNDFRRQATLAAPTKRQLAKDQIITFIVNCHGCFEGFAGSTSRKTSCFAPPNLTAPGHGATSFLESLSTRLKVSIQDEQTPKLSLTV